MKTPPRVEPSTNTGGPPSASASATMKHRWRDALFPAENIYYHTIQVEPLIGTAETTIMELHDDYRILTNIKTKKKHGNW